MLLVDRLLRYVAGAALPAAVLLLACGCGGGTAIARADLRVVANHLVDGAGSGHTVRLLGVNRSGTEYACKYGQFFDGPSSAASIRAMKTWKINAVRVPLDEDCWLGLVRTEQQPSAAAYRTAIKAWIARLHAAGLYVITDLHVAAPGSDRSTTIIPMPDADHAPDFWRSVASTFIDDHRIIFDLYNEPHDISWDCWQHGCQLPAGTGDGENAAEHAYRSAGMQDLVDAVRSTGARQPLMLGGLGYSNDLSQWLAHEPADPLGQLVASEHNYGGLSPCVGACQQAMADTAVRVPVVAGELGEDDCRHGYIDKWMAWADRHDISYLGWTWDAVKKGGWSCKRGPSLIKDYKGTPTAFGIGLRDHLRALARHN